MHRSKKMENMKLEENWKRPFFPFWASQMLSLLGSSLVQFSLVWWLTKETGSATVLAMASMFALIPEIVIQPFAGAITDRINRKKVIILSDAAIALATLVLGVFFFLDHVEIWYIYVIMMIRGIGSAFHYPAEQASVSLMVPKDQLARIAGLNQAAKGVINIVAAPMGALVMDLIGVEGSLLIDVVTAILAIGIVSFTFIPRQQQLAKKDGTWFGVVMHDMKEGFQYLIGWKGLMVITVMALIFKIALSPAFSLIPLLVSSHFLGDAAKYSMVEVAAGIGIIGGGSILGMWGGFKKKVYTMLMGGIGVGLGMILLGSIPQDGFFFSLPTMFLIGFMIPMVDGSLMAIMQEKIDNEYQGRVFTMFGSILYLSTPVGLAIAGPVSDALGVQFWFILAGVLVILTMAGGLFFKSLREIEKEPVVNPNKSAEETSEARISVE
ncbi:MAG: MFS transporter [Anaerolineaceae bacterium]|nr:MAG: MFS transporter [Anaerolineaceae bacterium]